MTTDLAGFVLARVSDREAEGFNIHSVHCDWVQHDYDDYGCNIVRNFAAYQDAGKASSLREHYRSLPNIRTAKAAPAASTRGRKVKTA